MWENVFYPFCFSPQSKERLARLQSLNHVLLCVFQLLDALELSQSPLLLKLMAGILCRDRKHIMEEPFQTCFQRIARRLVKLHSWETVRLHVRSQCFERVRYTGSLYLIGFWNVLLFCVHFLCLPMSQYV